MSGILHLGPHTLGRFPLVVGVATRLETLDAPPARQAIACDVLEIRLDLMGQEAERWLREQSDAPRRMPPILLTLRSVREGGRFDGSDSERIARYTALLPFVAAVDVELESPAFAEVCAAAHAMRRCVIGSFHDFSETPPDARLRALLDHGRRAGADIVKIATWTGNEKEIARLAALLGSHGTKSPLALMGMGPFGPDSRLRLAAAGSVLVYGFLDEPNAPGQPSGVALVRNLSDAMPAYRAARAALGTDGG